MESASAAPAESVDPAAARCAWATPLVLGAAAACMPFALAAGPNLYDAGELVSAAWSLGGSHPPGQPLHALLAHFAALLPLGPIPARIALFSATCAIAAAWFASRIARELALHVGATARDAELGAAAAALALLLTPAVLRQTLRVEVYTLALALALAAALQLLRWACTRTTRRLWCAALLAGLAGAVHPPHALAVALSALGLLALQPQLLAGRARAVMMGGIAFGLFGLSAYAYLPARAAAGANMWGDALSAHGLWSYVSAKAYAHNVLQTQRGSVASMVFAYVAYVTQQGAGVAWLGAIAAWLLAPAPRSRLLLGAALGSALALLAACIQPLELRNPDNVAYLGPCFGLAFASAGAAYARLLGTRVRWLGGVGLLLVALQPAALQQAIDTWRSDLPALETLAGSLLDAPPPRALVIATTDFTAATWMMQQDVDGARPDAAMFVTGLSTSSWMWARVGHHPALHGRPQRGPGRDAHEQFVTGLLLRALPAVPVALERDVPGVAIAAITGAYAIAGRSTRPAPPSATDQRFDAAIASAAARGPDGDAGAGAAIVRDYQRQRALRLLASGRARAALGELERSLWPLPAAQRALLHAALVALPAPIAMPHVVDDPHAFLVSLEDSVRSAAALLWALGRADAANALLQAQAQRGDARSLLQLAWLQAASADRDAAARSLNAFLRAAPELRAEAGELAATLQH